MDSRPVEGRTNKGADLSAPRVLIVKFSAIGDCVMAVPVASAIRRSYPESFITWAVADRCAPVIDTVQLVDLRYEIPRDDWKRKRTSWLHQYRYFARLRQFKFDVGLDLQGHSKTALCLRIAQPGRRVSSRATDVVSRALNPVAPIRRPLKHTVERNLQVLESVLEIDSSTAPIMPSLNRPPFATSSKELVTVAVSAGHPKKCYSIANLAEVGRNLVAQGFLVAFLGGKNDPSPDVPGALNLVGKLSLAETMFAVGASRVHLAADTGTGHIAAAYGVPVVSVFGYTDPAQYRPYTDRAIVLNAGRNMDQVSPCQVIDAVGLLVGDNVHAVLN